MQLQSLVVALGSLVVPSAAGAIQGFSYGSTNTDGSCRGYNDFKGLFERAKNLLGTSGFPAARLYTSIQCGTTADPIAAYQAAIDTDTTILVGLWASAGRDVYQNELNSLITAAKILGTPFADRLLAVSVGSEDLYRNSSQGVINGAGVGATADEITGYIGWTKDWIRGTLLEGKLIMHVDTWYVMLTSTAALHFWFHEGQEHTFDWR
jgi:glucan endo-1,3-beta-D-glucosidase